MPVRRQCLRHKPGLGDCEFHLARICLGSLSRQFYHSHITSKAPIADEAMQRIGQLFDVERAAMGRSSDER